MAIPYLAFNIRIILFIVIKTFNLTTNSLLLRFQKLNKEYLINLKRRWLKLYKFIGRFLITKCD